MDNKNPNRSLIPSQGGIIANLALRARLIARLMGDKRISPMLKLIPLAAAAYLIFPFDISAVTGVGLIPGLSAIDDAAIVAMASYLFIEYAPAEVVKEHLRKLLANRSNNDMVDKESTDAPDDNEDFIDGEITDIHPK